MVMHVSAHYGSVETSHFFMSQLYVSSGSVVATVCLGLCTKNSWLGSGKGHVLAVLLPIYVI